MSQAPWAASTTNLTSPSLLTLIDAAPHEIDAAPLDYLFIELVLSFRRSAAVAHARFKRIQDDLQRLELDSATDTRTKKPPPPSPEVEIEQMLIERLEKAGSHVGSSYTER